MRAMFFSLIFFAASPATAQQVYKCVNGSEVSYQSAACDSNWKVAGQWDATPEAVSPTDEYQPRQLKIRSDRAEAARHAAGSGPLRSVSNGRTTGNRKSSLSRCDAAKARREAKLKSVGLNRTFDLLRRLDDMVNEACK
jgi:hypothetical protein